MTFMDDNNNNNKKYLRERQNHTLSKETFPIIIFLVILLHIWEKK